MFCFVVLIRAGESQYRTVSHKAKALKAAAQSSQHPTRCFCSGKHVTAACYKTSTETPSEINSKPVPKMLLIDTSCGSFEKNTLHFFKLSKSHAKDNRGLIGCLWYGIRIRKGGGLVGGVLLDKIKFK